MSKKVRKRAAAGEPEESRFIEIVNWKKAKPKEAKAKKVKSKKSEDRARKSA